MKAWKCGVPTLLVLAALAGCNTVNLEGERVDYKSAAAKARPLEVPPDLTTPSTVEHYAIPEDAPVGSTRYSEFAKGELGGVGRSAKVVLPETKNAHIERNGEQRVLVVNDRAENVWSVVRAFWLEQGFVIKSETPQTGVMETDWLENRAKIPQDAIRTVLSKVIDSIYSSGERDQYHTRLERGKDGNSTEIYVTHKGMEEVLDADKNSSTWRPRAASPGLEATMLQGLMAKWGNNTTEAVNTVASSKVAPKLQSAANGAQVIVLAEAFDKSWRKVALALERANINVEDKNRASGVFFVRVADVVPAKGVLDKLAFWRSDESKPAAHYQVQVRSVGETCEVSANGDGASTPDTQRLIEKLFKALSQ